MSWRCLAVATILFTASVAQAADTTPDQANKKLIESRAVEAALVASAQSVARAFPFTVDVADPLFALGRRHAGRLRRRHGLGKIGPQEGKSAAAAAQHRERNDREA